MNTIKTIVTLLLTTFSCIAMDDEQQDTFRQEMTAGHRYIKQQSMAITTQEQSREMCSSTPEFLDILAQVLRQISSPKDGSVNTDSEDVASVLYIVIFDIKRKEFDEVIQTNVLNEVARRVRQHFQGSGSVDYPQSIVEDRATLRRYLCLLFHQDRNLVESFLREACLDIGNRLNSNIPPSNPTSPDYEFYRKMQVTRQDRLSYFNMIQSASADPYTTDIEKIVLSMTNGASQTATSNKLTPIQARYYTLYDTTNTPLSQKLQSYVTKLLGNSAIGPVSLYNQSVVTALQRIDCSKPRRLDYLFDIVSKTFDIKS